MVMRLILDPGHMGVGNMDCGAVGGGVYECNITLSIAKLVADIVSQYGVEVKLTRTGNDAGNSLQRKCDIANEFGADYFISIHCNAADAVSANGSETFSYSTSGKGRELAAKIQPKLVQAIGTTDRGLKTANYYVLKNTHMPAVLVETAFITNDSDRAKLLNSQSQIANAIARGFLEQAGITYTGSSTSTSTSTSSVSTNTLTKNLQHFINENGVDSLTEDGLIGPRTRAGIKKVLDKIGY